MRHGMTEQNQGLGALCLSTKQLGARLQIEILASLTGAMQSPPLPPVLPPEGRR